MQRDRVAFYTCFFGGDTNWANIIPECPTDKYDCYYFTNNSNTYSLLQDTKWISIYMPEIAIKNDPIKDALDAKILKACPHRFKSLLPYKYTCYFDSKLIIDVAKVEMYIGILENTTYKMVMATHSHDFHNVWDEYNIAIQYDKYAAEKSKYETYLKKQLNNGFNEHIDTHFVTGFIVRESCRDIWRLSEAWYSHIQECGIECQISFSIIQQRFDNLIYKIKWKECFEVL